MRKALAAELMKLAAEDKRIILLAGDVGHGVFEEFQKKYPDQYINCGIAEANMVSFAAGLSIRGYIPIIYAFSTFTVGRALDQIRIDLAFQNLPSIIIGLGTGFTYALEGSTHCICEDIAIIRSLPNMTLLCPADPEETKAALRTSVNLNGPVYIRIGKSGEEILHTEQQCTLNTRKSLLLKPGTDICALSCGTITANVLKASEILADKNISMAVYSFPSVKPLDTETLSKVFSNYSLIVTIEEHNLIGGFGSAIAEWVVDKQYDSRKLLRIGTPDEFIYVSIKQQEARDKFSLSPKAIAKKIYTRYQ